MKRALIVYYSQTGQLTRMAQAFAKPLQAAGVAVDWLAIEPQRPYAFPWKFGKFFNTFPETVHLQPQPIKPFALATLDYDVVVLAYTVWFLSPSQPIIAFLQQPQVTEFLRGKPVITLIGCRNMWLMAQEVMKQQLQRLGARLVGNVVKIDVCSSAMSFVTTPAWLLTGRKQLVGLPAAGISDTDIADMARFGARLGEVLSQGKAVDETLYRGMGAVAVNEKLITSEKLAKRSFYLWGKLLMAAGQISPYLRCGLLYVYVLFLIAMILTVVPFTALLKMAFRRLLANKIAQEKAYFSEPSGE